MKVQVEQVPRTMVAIATYQRPEMLRRLLESLSPVLPRHRIVVVDNDAARSAETVVGSFPGVEYLHEPEPGIVAARNRGLEARVDEDLIAFVDDDEWVCDDWLTILYSTMEEQSADVVVGPVLPVFPDGAPAWATGGEYYNRKRSPTGTSLRDAPTNNTLVRSRAIFGLDEPRFDSRFSDTGGSDTELFTRIKSAGAHIVWCDEALTWENVPESRLTKAWVVQRQKRLGNVRGRIAALSHSKPYVFALGLAYLGYGALRMALTWLRTRRTDTFAHMRFWRGVGIMQSLRGRFVREYARSLG